MLSRLDRLFTRAPDPVRTGWLTQHLYAHRGLHGPNGEGSCRVENSPAAFRAAIDAGMGIECDIQRSRDDQPMVFHDWDFTRLIGRPEKAAALTAEEWKTLSFLEGEGAPLVLADLLALIAGRVPVLIEVKSRRGYDVERSCEAVAAALEHYSGRCAVMSFDPRVSRWFRRHAPDVVRGLVMREDDKGYTQKAWQRHLALWIARPEFIAYHVAALPNPMVSALRQRGMPVLTWTVDSAATRSVGETYADALIAEGDGLP